MMRKTRCFDARPVIATGGAAIAVGSRTKDCIEAPQRLAAKVGTTRRLAGSPLAPLAKKRGDTPHGLSA